MGWEQSEDFNFQVGDGDGYLIRSKLMKYIQGMWGGLPEFMSEAHFKQKVSLKVLDKDSTCGIWRANIDRRPLWCKLGESRRAVDNKEWRVIGWKQKSIT